MFYQGRINPWPVRTLFNMERYRSRVRVAWLPRFSVWYVPVHTCTLPCLISFLYPDLYGRGYSDAPQTTYDAYLYTTQLALLMQYLRWHKAIIVGYSMVS